MTFNRILTAFAGTIGLAGPALAVTVTHDQAAFLGATGAAALVIPNTGVQSGGAGTIGPITFSITGQSTQIYFGLPGSEWSTNISGNDIALSSPEDMLITSSVKLDAFGFFLDEPTTPGLGNTDVCNADCFDTTFTFDVFNGTSLVGSFTDAPGGTTKYYGFSGMVFDRIVVNDVTGTIDNEFFGDFAYSIAPIPLPASLPLALLGLGALAALRRRRKP